MPHPYPAGGARDFIAAAARRRAEGREWVFAILEEDGFRGLAGFLVHDLPVRHGEVGYWLGAPFRGRGLATLAARLAVDFAFRETGLPFLRARCLERNPASARVLEKAGFTYAGPFRNGDPKWPEGESFRAYALSRAAWQAARGRRTVGMDLLPGLFSLCRLDPASPLPPWADGLPLGSATRTADELSLLCPSGRVPPGVRSEGGWRALVLRGPFGFGETGILASVLDPLAEREVGILALSTFDTDVVLVMIPPFTPFQARKLMSRT